LQTQLMLMKKLSRLLTVSACLFIFAVQAAPVLAGPQCTTAGGVCKANCDTVTENNQGALDCTAPDGNCCVPKAATPAPAVQPTAQPEITVPETETVNVSGDCRTDVGGISFPCPLGERNVSRIIGSLIRWVLGLVGALFFAMFVYGGFMYIIAGENAKNAETGQKTLINAVIGLSIVVGAYMVLGWLLGIFEKAF